MIRLLPLRLLLLMVVAFAWWTTEWADAHPVSATSAIRQVFGENARAVKVARCESRLNPRAVSPTGDYGLFQLNRRTWDPARNPRARPYWPRGKDWRHVFDPVVNARVAYAISRRGTDFWTHWRWSARCWA